MENTYTYETERLYLRPTNLTDADLYLKTLNSKEFIAFVGDRNVRTLDEAETYIKERNLPQIEQKGYGNFTLILKENGEKIGGCGIFHRDGLDVVDIGFSLLPEYYQKGFGFEASKRILQAGFQDFGMQNISAITVEENMASRKLIEKLGLTYKKTVNIPNDPEDLLYYEISKEEWEKQNL